MKRYLIHLIAVLIFTFPDMTRAEIETPSLTEPQLVKAVMCEAIERYAPVNEAVVFSIDLGKLSCFTTFDPVPEQTIIYHKWYHRGVLISSQRLTINPPSWSSFTSMPLRATDKGPWQVEITDADGKIYRTLRFSITD